MDGGGISFVVAGVGIPFGMFGVLVVVATMLCVGGEITLAAVPSSAVRVRIGDVVVRIGDVVVCVLALYLH